MADRDHLHAVTHAPWFATTLIRWHAKNGRQDLPWQATRDPYRVWLSEIMLQQTQVASVIPYYLRFLARFESLEKLAHATEDDVMRLWSGLGYYARARNLLRCAKLIAARGAWPEQPADLAALPGIGRSTANAIANFCFQARLPILDGNVKRVLCRVFAVQGYHGTPVVERRLWQLAAEILPEQDMPTYTQAQMDFGALVCTRRRPRCEDCPLVDNCRAHQLNCVDKLPEARAQRTLPWRETVMLMLCHKDKIWLQRRPSVGIWGGLLCLPEVDQVSQADAAVTLLGLTATHWQTLPPVLHTFTHFRLRILPLRAEVRVLPMVAQNVLGSWVDSKDIAAAALPAPVKKMLMQTMPD